MKATCLFVFALLSTVSYGQTNDKDKVLANSLVQTWNVGFDSDDPENIEKILATRVTMISGDTYYSGRDSVMGNFVVKRMPLISNLNAVNSYFSVSKDMVYTAGRYSLDVRRKDGTTDTAFGNFTFIWTRQKDNSFKIEFLHIESIPGQ